MLEGYWEAVYQSALVPREPGPCSEHVPRAP
jgi:hypothetical protein